MRASISTWRTGMSILAIIACTSSSLDGMSVTKSWLVRCSKMTLPRGDRMRPEFCPVALSMACATSAEPTRLLAMVSALV